MIHVVEITWTLPDGATTVQVAATEAIPPLPSNDPDRPNQTFAPVLREAPNVELALFRDIGGGLGTWSVGTVTLSNTGGLFRDLRGAAPGAVRVWQCAGVPRAWSDLVPVFAGTAEAPSWDIATDRGSDLVVTLRDARRSADEDLNAAEFAGTSTYAGQGYEGAESLAGSRKPRAFGAVSNAPLPLANPAEQVYLVSADPGRRPAAIYERGEPAGMTDDGDLSGAAFDAASPAAAHFVTDSARSLLKVGSPLSDLTVDLAAVGDGTAAGIAAAILTEAGQPLGDTWATIGATPACGLWTGTGAQDRGWALELLARSIGGWIVPDGLGRWQVGRLEAPAGAPVRTLAGSDIISLTRATWGTPVPVWSVDVAYDTNPQPLALRDIPEALRTSDPERTAWLQKAERLEPWREPTVRERWPAARAVTLQTALRHKADAAELAARWGALHGVWREALTLVAPGRHADLPLGVEVRVVYPAQGLDRLYRVVRLRPAAPNRAAVTLGLWG